MPESREASKGAETAANVPHRVSTDMRRRLRASKGAETATNVPYRVSTDMRRRIHASEKALKQPPVCQTTHHEPKATKERQETAEVGKPDVSKRHKRST
jgi:hypothetical protein